MTPNTTGAAELPEALPDFEVRKLAAIGAVSTSSGLVERRPIEYRRELEDQFVRGFRAAEKRLHAQVSALSAAQAGVPAAKVVRDDRVPEAWTNLLAYVLQDDLHNRLTPRIIDIAYTAFMSAKRPNDEDGGPSDWYNDTRPAVRELIAKLRKDLIEDLAAAPQSGTSNAPQRDFSDVLEIQRLEAESNPADAYMVGLYNGMAMMVANYKGDTNWEPMKTQAPSPAPAQPRQEWERSDLPPLPDVDLRDVGTTSKEIRDFLRGYATEYARAALAARATADSVPCSFGGPELQAMILARCVEKDQADSVLEDAARLEFEMQHGSAIGAASKQGATP